MNSNAENKYFRYAVPKCWNTTNRSHLEYDLTVAVVTDNRDRVLVRHLPKDDYERERVLRFLSKKGTVRVTECAACSQ